MHSEAQLYNRGVFMEDTFACVHINFLMMKEFINVLCIYSDNGNGVNVLAHFQD